MDCDRLVFANLKCSVSHNGSRVFLSCSRTILNRLHASRFTHTQLDPNEWSELIAAVDLTAPLTYGLLVVAILFLHDEELPITSYNILDLDPAFF